jgi:hypothetical protein
MKKANVLQLTFVLIGVVFGILSLPSLFTLLVGIFGSLFNESYDQSDFIIYNVFIALGISLQVFVCWLLIVRSAKFAVFIQKKSGLGADFKIISKPNDLLNILLIVIGIYLLLSNLSPLLTAIFQSFKSKSTSGIQRLYEDARPIDWGTIILNIILPLVLLMFSKPIADYFTKNINEQQVSMEETETINKTDLLDPTED